MSIQQILKFLIETNIKTITNKYNFYNGFRRINKEAIYDNIGQNGWGESFKDILVIDEKLYISFTDQINQKCLKMSIIVGDINLQYIEFEKLYSTQDCIDPNTEPYNGSKLLEDYTMIQVINFLESEILKSFIYLKTKVSIKNYFRFT